MLPPPLLSFAQGVSLVFEQQLHCYYLVAFENQTLTLILTQIS